MESKEPVKDTRDSELMLTENSDSQKWITITLFFSADKLIKLARPVVHYKLAYHSLIGHALNTQVVEEKLANIKLIRK